MIAVDDKEKSSAIGSAVVLRNFIKIRGAEMFHAVPEIVQDSLAVSFLSHFFLFENIENSLKPEHLSHMLGGIDLYNTGSSIEDPQSTSCLSQPPPQISVQRNISLTVTIPKPRS